MDRPTLNVGGTRPWAKILNCDEKEKASWVKTFITLCLLTEGNVMNRIKLRPPCLLAMKGCTLYLRAILKPSFLKLLSSDIFIKTRRNINNIGGITDPN